MAQHQVQQHAQQHAHHHHEGKKIVTVFGATGKQGGSVVCALLKEGKFRVRGVARSRDETKVKELQSKGVEVVKANIATGEGLDDAFKCAYAAFIVTSSFDKEIENQEFALGTQLVEKAKMNGVKVLVWSTLPHVHKISGGKYDVPHFTEKAKVEEYIRNIQKGKDAFESVVFIAPAFYFQNFCYKVFAPKKDESGCHIFEFPQTDMLTACDITDIGPLFAKLLDNPHHYNNKTILLDGEHAPLSFYIQKFQEVTNQKACLKEISREEFERNSELHHAKQLAEMFAFMDEFHYFGKEKSCDSIHARDIYPHVKHWETYLRESGWKGERHP